MPKITEEEKKIILIVEDQTDLRDSLQELITSWNYRTATADTLQEGIQKAANQKFDLIILDISLHKSSGLKLLEQTRRSDLNINYFTPIDEPGVSLPITQLINPFQVV